MTCDASGGQPPAAALLALAVPLKITDMRFADIDGTPKRCTLMKL